jgi:hypothetical protein
MRAADGESGGRREGKGGVFEGYPQGIADSVGVHSGFLVMWEEGLMKAIVRKNPKLETATRILIWTTSPNIE